MRILVVGDQHFRYELPYSSAIVDGRKGEWEAVKKTIHDTASTCDAVVLIGDNFNARHNHSSVIREFVDFLNGFGSKEVHILTGNHERYGTSTALDFIDRVKKPNWTVYTEPTVTTVAGESAMIVPYMTPALLGVETNEEGLQKIIEMFPEGKTQLLFAHHGISGAKVHGTPMELFNEIVLPQKVLNERFEYKFAGHIHEGQVLNKMIFMIGNIFTNEVGEHEKSIRVYSRDKESTLTTVEAIPLPVRGIYKVEVSQGTQIPDMPTNSIVKCYVVDRNIPIDLVRDHLSKYDASIVIEQYPNERTKVHFEEGGLDLSIESMLKLYAEAKGLIYEDLKEGYELIK